MKLPSLDDATIAAVPRATDRLEIAGIKAKVVPDAIFKLPKLRELTIGAGVRALPEAIGDAKALRILKLFRADLRALPEAVGRTKLTTLAMHDSAKLKSVPAALWNVTTLEVLTLPDSVRRLPPGIGRLKKLAVLGLSGSAAASIADELSALKRLEKVNIYLTRKTETIPEELAQVPFETLMIRGHLGTTVPDVVRRMTKLQRLNVTEMSRLTTIIDVVEALPNLKVVDVPGSTISKAERRKLEALLRKRQ